MQFYVVIIENALYPQPQIQISVYIGSDWATIYLPLPQLQLLIWDYDRSKSPGEMEKGNGNVKGKRL